METRKNSGDYLEGEKSLYFQGSIKSVISLLILVPVCKELYCHLAWEFLSPLGSTGWPAALRLVRAKRVGGLLLRHNRLGSAGRSWVALGQLLAAS